VRGLEPPQPMLRVLERVAALGPDETDEPASGVIRIRIRRERATP
jgi:hypothetical protein